MFKYANSHSVIRQPPNPTFLSSPIECRIREVSLHVLPAQRTVLNSTGKTLSTGLEEPL